MNMRELRWKVLRPTDLTGKSYAELRRWIEDLVRALFPDNGIEYFADPDALGRNAQAVVELTPKEGRPAWVANVIATVFHGTNEGRHIDVALKLRDGTVRQITWAKSFGSGDECWAIARVVAEALELIMHYEDQPEIVDMYRLLPRESRFISAVKIPGGVTVERDEDTVAVRLSGGAQIAHRQFGGRPELRCLYMDAYQADWTKLLQIHGVPTTLKVCKQLSTPVATGPVATAPRAPVA